MLSAQTATFPKRVSDIVGRPDESIQGEAARAIDRQDLRRRCMGSFL
jgi:hypothetical protein